MKTTNRPDPFARGKRLAMTTFLTLSAHRSALLRKARRTTAEDLILNTLVDKMPTIMPNTGADDRAWSDFIGGVSATLRTIKELPNRKNKQPTK